MAESQRARIKRSAASDNGKPDEPGALNTSRPTSIPVPLTSLIGREHDAEEIGRHLRSGQVRLLTLTGPGGVGKTRLAIQVAATSLGSFADGSYFVSLASVSNPELVLSTIAQTLGVPEAGGQPLLNSLCAALKSKHLLLILDNFEQIVSAMPKVVDLLACAPKLHVVVTSRAVLRVYGEHEYPVSPLALPDASLQASLEQLTQCEAVRLFIERARAVRPTFTVSDHNAPAVAEICHRLDGLPLAIELAAARIKLMSPQALLRRLDRRLPLLTYGATTLPYRHQTLRDAIAWSYDLLTEGEKRLFRSLSVFRGGCTLEAAQAVCGDSGTLQALQVEATPYMDALAALVDKSLLRHEEQEDGEPRFSMLETIREFALEKLEAADSGSEVKEKRQLHAEYYLALAEEAQPHLIGPEQLAWANRIEIEHDNLRAALATLLSAPQPAAPGAKAPIMAPLPSADPLSAWVGLRLAGAIWQFWAMRGYLADGREWLQVALNAAQPLQERDPKILRGAGIGIEALARAQLKALNGIGVLARLAGDFPAARQALEGGLKIAREIGDQQAVAMTLSNLGAMATLRGDYADARRFLEECLAIRRGLGLELEAGYSLTLLGNVAMMVGDYAEARRLHEEGLAIKRRAGDKQGIGHSLHSLATIALREANYAEARRLDEETLAIARELGNKPGMAYSLRDLGNVACEQGDYSAAYKWFLESLALFRELGELLPIIECLIGTARVTAHIGRLGPATRLLGAAHAMLQTTEGQLDPPDRVAFERDLAKLRARLAEEAFTAAWEEGKALTLEKAIALALEGSPSESLPSSLVADAPSAPRRGLPKPEDELTAREIEVLRLVAAGLTNSGIATYLQVSVNTVQSHLRSIFSKININTRSAAVRYAFEHNLT